MRIPNVEMTAFSINSAGIIAYSHVEERNWTHAFHHSQKVTQHGLKTKCKT